MALSDYRLCDVCGGKAFYDANLNYKEADVGDTVYRTAGARNYFSYALDMLGDWAVLCEKCAKTHRCAIVPKGGE
jgi:hypothetical protein